MRISKQWLSIVAFAACLPFTGCIAAQTQPAFPKPSGPFAAGRLEIDIRDAARDEVFTDDPTDRRRLLVSVYYPATVPAGAQHGP